MNNLILYDYEDNKTFTTVDLDNLDDIFMIIIKIISGDEIAEVIYKNGDREIFDSSDTRTQVFFDGEKVIYSPKVNLIEEYKKRNESKAVEQFYYDQSELNRFEVSVYHKIREIIDQINEEEK